MVLIEIGEVMLGYVWCLLEFNDEVVVVVCGVELEGCVWFGL